MLGLASTLQAVAAELPFTDTSFDLLMAILTVHHRVDRRQELREAMQNCNFDYELIHNWSRQGAQHEEKD